RPIPRYRAALAAGRLPVERGIVLTGDDRRRRAVIESLMCNFAVDLGDDVARFLPELRALAMFEREGLIELEADESHTEIVLTPLGRHFVRNVAMVFDAYLPPAEASVRPAFSQ